MTLTLTDLFCGAGGSSTGAIEAPGIDVRVAANHWALAIETHNTNHQQADHICADISQIDPRLFPTTDLLWASPECTNHSRAKGRKRVDGQRDLWGEVLPDEAAERSRATMWDVLRFAEVHQYRAIVVENVVEVVDWIYYPAWRAGLDAAGYHVQVVSLNSMHAQLHGAPAPQSRDRVYFACTRKGDPIPDVRPRPWAHCPTCDETVRAVQSFKRPGAVCGRYRSQYVYRCPNAKCRNAIVEPGWLPASTIIDWTLKGERIGDRAKPLAVKTRNRIAAGIARYWGPMHGLATPSFVAELRGGGSTARPVSDPLATVTAGGNHHGLVTSYYGNNDGAKPTSEALDTVTTTDRHALIMRNNWGGSEMTTPVSQAIRTITTAGHQSLLTADDIARAARHVDDVHFRMLQPDECKRAMAFPGEYVILGNRREQVRMAGNAVTPPAARDLLHQVAAALHGIAA